MVRLADLVRLLNGEPTGNLNTPITGAAALTDAVPGDITFAAGPKYLAQAKLTQAAAVIVPRDFPELEKPVIRVSDARLAWAQVLTVFAPDEVIPLGVHPTAVVGDDVKMGKDVSVQEHVHIGEHVILGDRVVLYPGVYIGDDVEIGDDTLIYPNAVVRERVHVGRNCVVHPGVVIGADGFGFVPTAAGHVKVPHIGTVIIEDDVEIGANTTIDRGTTGATRIGRGTKIDNLVQVGHNAQISPECILVALTGIAGSSVLLERVTMGGQSGTSGHLKIGENSVVMARGLVAGDLPARSIVSGFPARDHAENMRIIAEERRLPDMRKTVADMKRKYSGMQSAEEELAADMRELEKTLERLSAANERLKERLAELESTMAGHEVPARGDDV